ncbi:MAG: sodium:proton antiporter [Deltaproteobacteria bacterium]|nr:sodium:proton antiporter [Deltaproteobacteria bacterium]
MIPLWTALPFTLLLLSIAILPMTVGHFWESHRNKGIVALGLSVPIIAWLIGHNPHELAHTLHEYFSFVVLLGALFTISGGIFLSGDLQATPRVNSLFLAVGAILASLIGTTGASMVLIRPFLRTNSEREKTSHLPVFFIFVVSNCGGLLTPLGDPPLFLGYLRGVPFTWTLKLFPAWALVNALIILIFYAWDQKAYSKETKKALQKDRTHVVAIQIHGWKNLIFLGGVIYGVFLSSPHREVMMLLMTLFSYFLGSKTARHQNHFSWGPIIEIAVLFAGIFVTMVPALMLLKAHGPSFGITKPWQFFWLTGSLSSFLDNAPTYVTLLSLAQGLGLAGEVVGVPEKILAAISTGAVFMGASSYIGNGPNFMVKAIADHAGFKTPSFFGYMGYAAIILLPIFFAVTLIFFR